MSKTAGRRGLLRYERRHEKLLPSHLFRQRLATHGAVAFGLVFACLAIGAIGYHLLARLGWIDSFLNASMILSGMGPVDPLSTDAAKIFATCYAIFSGVAFLGIVGVLLAPVLHRFLHRFHLEMAGED
jgi:hypothetical protein